MADCVLPDLPCDLGAVVGLERTPAVHISGQVLHSTFWKSLSPDGGGRPVVEQVYDHQGNIGNGSIPLLVFDAWEHAFYLQYKNVKADFFSALWNIVNWNDVASRLAAARLTTIAS